MSTEQSVGRRPAQGKNCRAGMDVSISSHCPRLIQGFQQAPSPTTNRFQGTLHTRLPRESRQAPFPALTVLRLDYQGSGPDGDQRTTPSEDIDSITITTDNEYIWERTQNSVKVMLKKIVWLDRSRLASFPSFQLATD